MILGNGNSGSINAIDVIDTTLPYARADETITPEFDVYEDASLDIFSRRPNPWILHLDRATRIGSPRIHASLLSAINHSGAGAGLDCVLN